MRDPGATAYGLSSGHSPLLESNVSLNTARAELRAARLLEARHRPRTERARARISAGLRRYWASPRSAERRARQSAEFTEINRLVNEAAARLRRQNGGA